MNTPIPDPKKRPTAEALAGIPVSVEGNEDLTVRPARPEIKLPPPAKYPAVAGPDELAGVPVCVDGD